MTWLACALVAWLAVPESLAVAQTSGFRAYEGKHIRLRIDVGTKDDAKQYVDVFDAAVKQWVAYWSLPVESVSAWRVDAVIMSDRQQATMAGLMKDRIPDFKFGFNAGRTLYLIAQPSHYYTEHLLLHEGVHAFARHTFGGLGPTWFMEGTAEILATHQGSGANVIVNRIPRSRDDSPFWGRVKVIRDAHDSGSIPSVESVMRMPPRLDGDITAYSWAWTLVMLLTQYPEYDQAFRAMTTAGHDGSNELSKQLYQRLSADWPAVVARYRLLGQSLDYGFDWDRERVTIHTGDASWTGKPISMQVLADQGWQSSGVVFPAGMSLSVESKGESILALQPKPWRSLPEGVTIRYHRGLPIGKLVGCLVPINSNADRPLSSLETVAIGAGARLDVAEPSWLVMRVNDDVGELADNSGHYEVTIRATRYAE